MGERFSCAKCGKCCDNNLIGCVEAQNSPDDKIRGEEKGPVYTNPKAFGLPMLDFEKVEMEKEAKKFGIKASFVSEKFCFDSLTNTKIVASWKLEGVPCPFLSKEKRCLIYSKRPFVCRRFPLLIKDKVKIVCSKKCPALNQKKLEQLLYEPKDFKKFFSKQLNALQKGRNAIELTNSHLGKLYVSGKASFVYGITQEQISEKWPQQKIQGLFEFVETKNFEDNSSKN